MDPSWEPLILRACDTLDPQYIQELSLSKTWLPGPEKIFSAFSLPIENIRYILFGESPYPRATSANGYAFWDAAVNDIWSKTGLATAVNRATSLRNLVKMLLVADGRLTATDTSQAAIAQLNKSTLVQTNNEFFSNFQQQGILLLNASLVLRDNNKQQDARLWLPFMQSLLAQLASVKTNIELILLGKIAESIKKLPSCQQFSYLQAEHPYNISFINNQSVLDFFRPLQLLQRAT